MTPATQFCPIFERPPVVETRISLQFKPLSGVRAAHFGLFWQECLGATEWVIGDDGPLVQHESERFDSALLNPPPEDLGEIDSLAIRSFFRSVDGKSTAHFQPDRLIYSYARQGDPRPSFAALRAFFDPFFGRFQEFARRHELGEVSPDLWEVSYTNAVPRGLLWQTPCDWHQVVPRLFTPGGIEVEGHEWSTFEGEWFFVMPDKAGRVRVKASKAVANPTGEIVLLLNIRARGPLGTGVARTWAEGLDLGHQSAVRVFYDIVSPDARTAWGYKP